MADDNKIFDSTLYGGSLGDNSLPPYNDFSDAYANNKGAYITFQHESVKMGRISFHMAPHYMIPQELHKSGKAQQNNTADMLVQPAVHKDYWE